MDEETLSQMYEHLLTVFADYHVLCISMESCKDCPLEEVCESLVTAQSHLTALLD